MNLPAYANKLSNFPEMYERWLVEPLFQPWAEIVLDRAHLSAGDRMLDIACGTGIVARLAMKHLSGNEHVVGVDVSPQMLTVARAIEPRIDWREGDAAALPLREGERFDVVVCQQGLQFFPDKPAAVREMRRAIDRGGRLVVAVWKSLEEAPFFREIDRLAERRLGPFVDRRHSFGDPVALERLIADAGFENVRVESVTRTIRFAEPATLVHLNSHAVVGMSTACSTMTDEERARLSDLIAADSTDVVRQYGDGEGIAFGLAANVATARARSPSL